MAKIHTTNYVDAFIAVADDCAAMAGTVPPSNTETSVAELTHAMIAANPYRYTSDDVIFTVWADRRGPVPPDRPTARAQFFAKGQPMPAVERPRQALRLGRALRLRWPGRPAGPRPSRARCARAARRRRRRAGEGQGVGRR